VISGQQEPGALVRDRCSLATGHWTLDTGH